MILRGVLYARCSDPSQDRSVAQQISWAVARARELGVLLEVTEDHLTQYRTTGRQLDAIELLDRDVGPTLRRLGRLGDGGERPPS